MPRKKKEESGDAKKAEPKKVVKKMSAKKAASALKKVSKRKSTSKQKREPVIAEGAYCFYLQGGSVISSLEELHNALNAMSDDQYAYHTTDRNDFANWVDEVLMDARAAALLSKTKARDEAAAVLRKVLSLYN
ncbi:MAG: hypothetical protein Q8Q18_00295 [bacterium]|nr:hypothetical protein [bacterium]